MKANLRRIEKCYTIMWWRYKSNTEQWRTNALKQKKSGCFLDLNFYLHNLYTTFTVHISLDLEVRVPIISIIEQFLIKCLTINTNNCLNHNSWYIVLLSSYQIASSLNEARRLRSSLRNVVNQDQSWGRQTIRWAALRCELSM